ncbi:segregation/condensation protein A [Candidatus Woesearchaeota archaeon]|nr:segregation/condensation protein A [Candidatus Woesearchaeota archaeon]
MEEIYSLILDKDDVTWQSIIYELVRTEKMDPWDINISLLTARYLETLQHLKEADFRLSGKVVLAAAVLLKIKSNKLVGEDLVELEELMNALPEEEEHAEEAEFRPVSREDAARLIPRTPQPRKRKVSIYDLVYALQRALEVKKRRVLRSIPLTDINIPEKKRDITLVIRELYQRIKQLVTGGAAKVYFTHLVPSQNRQDKVAAFIPLLHLSNQRRIDLEQQEPFADIEISLASKREMEKEIS